MARRQALLRVFGRSYCSLCAAMLTDLQALQPEFGFRLEWVDIEDLEELEARYGEKVPVLVAGDEELCHYHLDRPRLYAYLSQMR